MLIINVTYVAILFGVILLVWVIAPKYVLYQKPYIMDLFPLDFVWCIPPGRGRQKQRQDEDEAEERKKMMKNAPTFTSNKGWFFFIILSNSNM